MRILILIVFLMISGAGNADAQLLWGIDLGNKEQYNQADKWGEVIDLDGSTYKQAEDIEFWGKAVFKDDTLRMSIRYPAKEQFDSAFILIVNEYGEPSIFGDRDLKAEREKEALKGDYTKKEEYGKVDDRPIEAIIQDGDLLMDRKWILVDYELELLWDKNGIRFLCKYPS